MVEKKSLASLANTSFMVASLRFGCGQDLTVANGNPYFARRYFGYHRVKYTALLRAANAMAMPTQSGRLGI